MNTKQDPTSDQLLINKISAHPKINAARFFKDAKDAAAIGRLSLAVLGRGISDSLHFSTRGTHIDLAPLPSLLQGMGSGCVESLTDLIAPLNSLLIARSEAIQGASNPGAALAASDEAFEELGFPLLRHVLIDLSGRKGRSLMIEDARGAGGILSIPPRPLLIVPQTSARSRKAVTETITRVAHLTEMVTHSGSAFVLRSSRVDDGVRVGSPARLLHPRPNITRWRMVHSVSHVYPSKESNP